MEHIFSFLNGGLSWIDIIVRIAVAVLVGVLIGMEREIYNHPAGMKTHALVCLGAAVTSMLSVEMCYELVSNGDLVRASVDMSRIAAGVVSGIGFIGAGAIITSRGGHMVTGITTAATVWISGCMGLAIGMGYFRIILIAMVGIFFTTITLKWLELKFLKNRRVRRIEVITLEKESALPMLEDYFDRKQIVITSFDCMAANENEDEAKATKFCCRYFLRIPKGLPFHIVMSDIAKMDEIVEAYEYNPNSSSAKKATREED